MKSKVSILAAAFTLSTAAFAQEDMPIAWEKKYEHKSERVGTGLEGPNEVSYIADDKEITVYKTTDGTVVWTSKFKELVPRLRKADHFQAFWESDALFVFDYKTGKDQLAVIDLNNGEVLWESTRYQGLGSENIIYLPEVDAFLLSLSESITMVKARTGEEVWETSAFKGSVAKYIFVDGDVVAFNMTPSGLVGFFKGYKNQIARIDLSNGDIKWQSAYVGKPEKKVITKEPLYDLKLEGDKLLLMLNGIQVFDFNTGAALWSAAYEQTPKVIGAPAGAKAFGVYGAVAKPVRVGNDVYVLQFDKKSKQFIKKYDYNTGKLLWTSPEIKKAKAIPNLFVIDDKVIAQIGGVVETQAYIRQTTPEGTTEQWIVDFQNVKPNGLQAFNTKDGSFAWDSEKFKKGITNGFAVGSDLYICSGKALYSINYKDGGVNYEVNIKSDGVGNATEILQYKDMIVMVGEKGVATHKMSDGSLVNSNKYKKAKAMKVVDNILLMVTAKNDFAAFNLDDCSYLSYNAKKDSKQELSEDGNFVWAYEKKNVSKLKTR